MAWLKVIGSVNKKELDNVTLFIYTVHWCMNLGSDGGLTIDCFF